MGTDSISAGPPPWRSSRSWTCRPGRCQASPELHRPRGVPKHFFGRRESLFLDFWRHGLEDKGFCKNDEFFFPVGEKELLRSLKITEKLGHGIKTDAFPAFISSRNGVKNTSFEEYVCNAFLDSSAGLPKQSFFHDFLSIKPKNFALTFSEGLEVRASPCWRSSIFLIYVCMVMLYTWASG